MEIILGASALAYVMWDRVEGFPSEGIERLMEIFTIAPCNLEYAWNLMEKHLEYVRIG